MEPRGGSDPFRHVAAVTARSFKNRIQLFREAIRSLRRSGSREQTDIGSLRKQRVSRISETVVRKAIETSHLRLVSFLT